MAQQQREENSVLFSLKELRRMEDDRIRKEDDEQRAQREAEQQAREAAERRATEEAERLVREKEENARKAEEEVRAREREHHLRLAEAERRARVEGEMQLQAERMRLEVHARKVSSPVKGIAIAVGIVVVVFGGVIWKLRADASAQLEAQQAERIRVEQESAKREAEQLRKYQALFAERQKALAAAQSEEERQRIQKQIEDDRERERARREKKNARPATNAPTPVKVPPTIRKPRDIDDDPLKGLKL
jgi:hypothetical protein